MDPIIESYVHPYYGNAINNGVDGSSHDTWAAVKGGKLSYHHKDVYQIVGYLNDWQLHLSSLTATRQARVLLARTNVAIPDTLPGAGAYNAPTSAPS